MPEIPTDPTGEIHGEPALDVPDRAQSPSGDALRLSVPPTPRQRRAQRHARLLSLGYSSYADYLHSPQWKATKARYRASDRPQDCGLCGEEENLQLHHLTYERVGEERIEDLTPLCASCHADVHVLERRGEIGLDFAGLVNAERAKRYRAERDHHIDHRAIQRAEGMERLTRLPLEQRLALVIRGAKNRHMDISSDLQVIKQRVSRMERKVDLAALQS